jgi:pyruvate-formate lyase-activating enzyme
MKITKQQLRRIIKEEKARLLKEGGFVDEEMARSNEAIQAHLSTLHDTINNLWDLMGPDELANELYGIADDIRHEALRVRDTNAANEGLL